ncbi:hypothetical protein WJ972_16910 [Achromobacter insuavis]
MTNQTNAVQEAERNAAAESYFDARPSLDTVEARRIYEAGFDRAYALLSKLRAEGVPVAVTDHRGDVHWKNGRKPGITLYAAPVASAPADERAAFKNATPPSSRRFLPSLGLMVQTRERQMTRNCSIGRRSWMMWCASALHWTNAAPPGKRPCSRGGAAGDASFREGWQSLTPHYPGRHAAGRLS